MGSDVIIKKQKNTRGFNALYDPNKRRSMRDVRYGSRWIYKICSIIMEDGKRELAENIVYKALDIAVKKLPECADMSMPQKVHWLFAEVRNRLILGYTLAKKRTGGMVHKIPKARNELQCELDWIKLLVVAVKGKKGKKRNCATRFAAVLVDTVNNTGDAVKMKEGRKAEIQKGRAYTNVFRNVELPHHDLEDGNVSLTKPWQEHLIQAVSGKDEKEVVEDKSTNGIVPDSHQGVYDAKDDDVTEDVKSAGEQEQKISAVDPVIPEDSGGEGGM